MTSGSYRRRMSSSASEEVSTESPRSMALARRRSAASSVTSMSAGPRPSAPPGGVGRRRRAIRDLESRSGWQAVPSNSGGDVSRGYFARSARRSSRRPGSVSCSTFPKGIRVVHRLAPGLLDEAQELSHDGCRRLRSHSATLAPPGSGCSCRSSTSMGRGHCGCPGRRYRPELPHAM